MTDNTAINGILFDGEDSGDVNVENFNFTNNNIENEFIDGMTLIQFNNFVNLNVYHCHISMNDANYLFNAIINGN